MGSNANREFANDFERRFYSSFRSYGGPTVALPEIEVQLARMPLDGVLGFLGYLSAQLAQIGYDAYHSNFQNECLIGALLDGFPKQLPTLGGMYFDGQTLRLPTQSVLVHERSLAWLSHLALQHCDRDASLAALSSAFRQRLFRLLLIANDLIEADPPTPDEVGRWDLAARREVALRFLRESQFNLHQSGLLATFTMLARHQHLLCNVLPTVWPEADKAFVEATGGVTLDRYFQILSFLVMQLYYRIKEPGSQWFGLNVGDGVGANRDELERIVGSWICTPEEYRQAVQEWQERWGVIEGYHAYDLVCLRRTPLVRARDDQFVCPVVSLLFAKIIDEPYFLFSNHPKGETFQNAMGKVYEDYAHGLVLRLASHDERHPWNVDANPTLERPRREVADSSMVAGDCIIAFEHKAKRADTEFLRGGPGDRILGPSAEELRALENGTVSNEESVRDRGLLTQGMRQQTAALSHLAEWARAKYGREPAAVFPLITHLAPLRVGEEVRRLYLEPLLAFAGYYSDPRTFQPQWLRVDDLETLVAFAERGGVDLIALLREKDAKARSSSFDWFLYRKFGQFPADKVLRERGLALLQETQRVFFPDAPPLE